MSNVRVLKLVTGEEVAAQVRVSGNAVEFENPDVVVLINPVVLYMIPMENGEPRPTMARWSNHTAGNEITIAKDKIVFNEPANEGLIQAYTQATGGIVTPPKGLVVPGISRR